MATRKKKADSPLFSGEQTQITSEIPMEPENFENFENFEKTSISPDNESVPSEETREIEKAEEIFETPLDSETSLPLKNIPKEVKMRTYTQPKMKPRRHKPRFSK